MSFFSISLFQHIVFQRPALSRWSQNTRRLGRIKHVTDSIQPEPHQSAACFKTQAKEYGHYRALWLTMIRKSIELNRACPLKYHARDVISSLAYPVLADPVLADPVLADPVLADPMPDTGP
jgi:hypothetical protein